jgi:butyryl-CoA dehydrogenase
MQRERPQGRKIDEKDLNKPQVLIIAHVDVKDVTFFKKYH